MGWEVISDWPPHNWSVIDVMTVVINACNERLMLFDETRDNLLPLPKQLMLTDDNAMETDIALSTLLNIKKFINPQLYNDSQTIEFWDENSIYDFIGENRLSYLDNSMRHHPFTDWVVQVRKIIDLLTHVYTEDSRTITVPDFEYK